MGAIELWRKVWEEKNGTCVLGRTHACVVVDSIDASGVVLAVVVLTVVDVDLTFIAFETFRTHAPEDHIQLDKHQQGRKINACTHTHTLIL